MFNAWCDLPVSEQRQRTAELSDPDLAATVERMLAADRDPLGALATAGEGAAGVLARDLASGIPDRIGPYRILGKLGEGGMGVVYEAEEDHPRRRVALKTVHPWIASARGLERFRFEAQAMAGVVHPGIPAVFAAGEVDGTVFLAMEKVEGRPIFEHVAAARLDEAQRVELVARIADVVEHAHARGLVHRDLKPANIRVGADGLPRVLDFGIAAQSLSEGGPSGTPAYASPEQLRGEPVDARADVYALGVMAYELLHGSLPHAVGGLDPGAAAECKSVPPVPLAGVSADLAWVVERALAPDPEERCSTVRELAEQLRLAIAHRPLPGRSGPVHRAALWSRRNRGALAIATGLGVGLLVLGTAWGLWVRAEHRARVERAADRMERLEPTLDRLAARGAWDEAGMLVRAFAEVPEHGGTPALSEVWRRHARRLSEGGQEGSLQAAASAWLAASDPASTTRSGATLARELLRAGRYDGAWEVARRLPAGEEVDALLQSTAVPRRVLDGAGLDPALAALGSATRLPIEAAGAAMIDLDDDGDAEILAFTAAEETVAWRFGPSGVEEIGRVPHPEGVVMQGVLMARDGARLLTAGRGDDGWATLYQAPLDLGAAWAPLARFGDGMPTDLAVVGSQVLVGTAWPDRRLVSIDLATGQLGVPHPPTDALGSDLSGVEAVDVDRDGEHELFVSQADWGSYLLQRLDAVDGSWRTTARQVVGTTTGVAVARGPQSARVYTVKVDRYRNTSVWGTEHPYGPPAGIYAFGDGLEPLGRLELPVGLDGWQQLDASQRIWAWPPLAADLDGDGKEEVLVGYRGFRGPEHHDLVVVTSALDTPRTSVLAGLFLLAAGDADGDGDDELLVSDEKGRVWLLGSGDQQIPSWHAPIAASSELPLAPEADAASRTVWQRADQLVEIGLYAEAAEGLRSFAAITQDPATAASFLERAALLLQQVEDEVGAARRYQELLEVKPDHPRARDEAVRLLRRGLFLDEAARLAGETPDPPNLALGAGSLEAYELQAPEVMTPTGEGWDLRLYNDRGEVASAPLQVRGERLGLSVDLDATVLEIGSGVAVEVLDEAGEVVLGIDLSVEGGGGAAELVARCLFDHPRQLRGWGLIGKPERVRVHTEWIAGRRGCQSAPDVRVYDVGDAPQTGRYRLRIRSAGQPDYRPPMLLAGELRIELRGATLAAEPSRQAASNDASRLAWEASRSADADGLRAAIRQLDTAARRRLLRDEVAAWPALHQALGERFVTEAATALVEPFVQEPWRADLFAQAQRSELDGVDPRTPDGLALALARAEVLRRGGRSEQAVRIASDVLARGTPGTTGRAHLVMARLLVDRDRSEARRHARLFVDQAANPDLARFQVEGDPRLHGLLGGESDAGGD